MLKKIPVKKEYLLIAGTILLLYAGYELAFQKTIVAWQLNKELKNKIAAATNIEVQPDYLIRKGKNIDQILALYKADTTTLRNNLINSISLLADKENVKVSEVPIQDLTYNSEHFIFEKLKFDGDYFSLMKLSAKIQDQKGVGIIRSENWIEKDNITGGNKTKKLGLEILLEYAK